VIDFATWRAAWNDLGVEPHEPLHQRLIACWSEKHRHYHTLQHLREVLEGFEQVRVDAQRPAEIVLALWFHDAIYDLQRNDNEQRSAQWAKESLLQAGLPEEAAQRLYDLVMATRHDQPPADPDAQLLVDMDLAILGADRARFDESDAQVRSEYAHVPEQAYRQGRRAVLRRFLDRPRLYSTGRFHSTLESRARENLQRALARLED
jgi:predicted metal-dependent HD superfamily phosphohydrolase